MSKENANMESKEKNCLFRDDCYLDSEQNTKYQQNKEMDFLAVLQKFKKDIMEEIEQKMTKLMGTTGKKKVHKFHNDIHAFNQ